MVSLSVLRVPSSELSVRSRRSPPRKPDIKAPRVRQNYALNDVSLVLECDPPTLLSGVEPLLGDLLFERTTVPCDKPTLRLTVCAGPSVAQVPVGARELFAADGFRGLEDNGDFVLTDGKSLIRIEQDRGVAEVRIAPDFMAKPAVLQRNFWSFGLMKLLRAQGMFTLHAAALARSSDAGLLLVASPSSGKSTLAIGLIRRGWNYLSDDAVLLHRDRHNPRVIAWALRKHFYVDSGGVNARYKDLRPQAPVADATGGQRQRVDVEGVFPKRFLPACLPRLIVFPQIESRARSVLEELGPTDAMQLLLRESGPQLFDHGTMPAHLNVIRTLLRQCDIFRLRAGGDLYADPGALESLLPSVQA